MELVGLLEYSQEHATGPEPYESNPHPSIIHLSCPF